MDNKETPEITVKMIECGDLALRKEVQNGILLFGRTKCGKTTSAHYLTHQQIIGKQDKTDPYYDVYNANPDVITAKIGLIKDESETQIPNKFPLTAFEELGDYRKNTVLFDCPGYSDSYGCSRVISNGYFHYRVFSKVKNIKFVLTFAYSDFTDTASLFKRYFQEFIKGFDEQKLNSDEYDRIFDSMAVMITKVSRNIDKDGVVNMFSSIKTTRGNKKKNDILKKFIDSMISKDKIFYLHVPEVGKLANDQNTDLMNIFEKTSFWTRPSHNNERIDMSLIKTSISQVLLKKYQEDEDFFEDFQNFGSFYTKVISDKLKNLTKVFQHFISNTFEGKLSYTEKIAEILGKEEEQIKKPANFNVLKLQKEFDIHKKTILDLYEVEAKKIAESASGSASQTPIEIQKVRVAEKISVLCEKNSVVLNRSLKDLEKIYIQIRQCLMSILNIKHDHQVHDKIKRYIYNVVSILEISNVFYRITYMKNDSSGVEKTDNPLNFIIVKYPTELQVLCQKVFENETITSLKIKHAHKIVEKSPTKRDSEAVIEYLNELKNIDRSELNIDHLTEALFDEINKKKYEVCINRADTDFKSLDKQRPDKNQLRKIIVSLDEIRTEIQDELDSNRKSAIQNQQLIFQSVNLLNIVAESFFYLEDLDSAIEIWEITMNPFKIFQSLDIYEKKRKWEMKNKDHVRQKFIFLEKYMEISKKFARYELSLEKAQEALYMAQLIQEFQKMEKVRKHILLLMPSEDFDINREKENERRRFSEKFIKWAEGGLYYTKLPQSILHKIEKIRIYLE